MAVRLPNGQLLPASTVPPRPTGGIVGNVNSTGATVR